MSQNLVFFGSAPFSVLVLEKLLNANCQIISVVTTPDQPTGRHLKLTPNPVKVLAQKCNIPVFTNIKDFLNTPASTIGLVAAYGRLLGPKTLAKFNGQVYNIHPSLLPKYRGPSPLQQQILDGITDTGVTVYQLDDIQDHGPIVAQAPDKILPNDTTQTLGNRLFSLGTNLFLNSPLGVSYHPQNEADATDTRLFTREDGFLPWEEFTKGLVIGHLSLDIERKHRAFYPWPGIWSTNPQGKRVKLLALKPEILIQEEGKKANFSI